MDQLQHFSHEHPLIFNEEKNIDDEINRDHFCSICKLPILLSSFYSCDNAGCMYLLHKPCALLPETMTHPWFPSSHFRLLRKSSIDDIQCKKCRQSCENFTYINNSDPNISFHPMCGVPMSSIKSKHKSHPLHPLVAVGKRTSAVCDACAEEQHGYFFTCHSCNFFIHVDCALLPQIIKCKKHRHYLILTYSNCDMYHTESSQGTRHLVCLLCSAKMFGSGAYSCAVCIHFAHMSCAIKDMTSVGTEKDLGAIYIPQADRSWVIRELVELKFRRNPALDRELLHDHPLILYNDTASSDSGSSSSSNNEVACCNACMEPIYPPFYACSDQSSRCHFHLHQLCSALPSGFSGDRWLRTQSKKGLCSLFYCSLCHLLGNGFSYHKLNNVDYHITCAFIAGLIKHESHKQHFLHSMANQSNYRIKKCCSDPKTGYGYLYRCFDCDFIIDNVCAFLPGKIKHKYDIHPLDLITTGIAKFDDNNLCEFCEERIDTSFWYYGCEECDNLFHVKCIPSVGSLSKVKFGSSIDVSCHPPHPVTFVRMLGFGSQRCGYCKEIVEGFVDEMAFHCSNCDFWIHFKCAEECTGAEKILPPIKFVLVSIN